MSTVYRNATAQSTIFSIGTPSAISTGALFIPIPMYHIRLRHTLRFFVPVKTGAEREAILSQLETPVQDPIFERKMSPFWAPQPPFLGA